jgi:hypothetical protein
MQAHVKKTQNVAPNGSHLRNRADSVHHVLAPLVHGVRPLREGLRREASATKVRAHVYIWHFRTSGTTGGAFNSS